MTDAPREDGPWTAGVSPRGVRALDRVWIQSHDFTHDARLYVSGDFEDEAHALRYAEEIAWRLNAWPELEAMRAELVKMARLIDQLKEALAESGPKGKKAW